ncbi:hypothetical protein [Nannocystis punicea]|uniref:Lipoprotein n=1 Tax=Nannocystis punicea TaxID=2995304 RepID=A0ABY7GSG2_9BACT|nr:hypothetical protein [Nannocystis poenicansa]WAS89886.1 hypothetical protein O0S08_27145 [Nannocystis poenicansa]
MNRRELRRAATSRAPQWLLLLLVSACSRGSFGGEVTNPDTAAPEPAGKTSGAQTGAAAPAVKHENVVFHWTSGDDSLSGRIKTKLPDGESFTGKYHEISRTATVDEYGDFYNAWYADPWMGPSWYWGGSWPYYDTVEEFITNNTGKVVATLQGDRGTKMRCRFTLDDPDRGIKGGGTGECQLSNGERITTRFESQ